MQLLVAPAPHTAGPQLTVKQLQLQLPGDAQEPPVVAHTCPEGQLPESPLTMLPSQELSPFELYLQPAQATALHFLAVQVLSAHSQLPLTHWLSLVHVWLLTRRQEPPLHWQLVTPQPVQELPVVPDEQVPST